jgi:hypothetical protein
MQPAQSGKRSHFRRLGWLAFDMPTHGCVSIQTEVAAIIMVVLKVLFEKTYQVLFAEYDDMVEELCPR